MTEQGPKTNAAKGFRKGQRACMSSIRVKTRRILVSSFPTCRLLRSSPTLLSSISFPLFCSSLTLSSSLCPRVSFCYSIHNTETMTSKEILNKIKEKVGLGTSADSQKGKSKMSKQVTHGFHLVKGKSSHPMEDYAVADFKQIEDNELGLFAIFDGHLSHEIPDYLKSHLLENIINEPDFWREPEKAIRRAYRITDANILEKAPDLGEGGSTAVTAILINCRKLVVANVGDSRAVICKNGVSKQLSVDHEPSTEKEEIKNRGGFVSNLPGDVPRVDGLLAVGRSFGDRSLKDHLSSEPNVVVETIDDDTEFIILASDGLWKVMTNQEAVDSVRNIKDARAAAKQLIDEALSRNSTDDISCIVVRFQKP